MPEDAARVSSKDLVAELRDSGLDEVNAYRSAFTALAIAQGWSHSRVGKYLGVTRVRVGQRIERLKLQTETKDVPLLTQLLKDARTAQPAPSWEEDLPIAFEAGDWKNSDFALGVLAIVARDSDDQ